MKYVLIILFSSCIVFGTSQIATETTLGTVSSTLTTISGKMGTLGQKNMAGSSPVVISSDQASIPVASTLSAETTKIIGTVNISSAQTIATVTNLAQMNGASIAMGTGVRSSGTQRVTIATDDVVPVTGTFWQSTQPVSIATAPVLVAGSAIIGKVGIDQTTPGTTNGVQINAAIPAGANVIGHVINDTGSTTAVTGNVASTVADGANVTLGAKADAKSTATDSTAVTIMQVLKEISAMEQAPASRAVTNAGTFAAQCTMAAETTKVIGTVNISSGQTVGISAGSAVIGHTINDSGSTTAVTGNVASTVADGANVVLGSKADAKSTATDTTAITIMQVLKEISAMEQAPASRAVTNAGTFAVQAAESDGANVTLGAKADAKSTATDTTAVTIMSVLKQISASVQAPPSQAVTNAGTFAVQATISGSNPCFYPGATLLSVAGATSTNNATQIIALSGSTKIYVCSLTVIGVSGTSPTFSLVQGTGSNCASTQTTVVQAFATTANQLYQFATPVAVGVAGNALCYKDGGTSPVENYQVTYVQQ